MLLTVCVTNESDETNITQVVFTTTTLSSMFAKLTQYLAGLVYRSCMYDLFQKELRSWQSSQLS